VPDFKSVPTFDQSVMGRRRFQRVPGMSYPAPTVTNTQLLVYSIVHNGRNLTVRMCLIYENSLHIKTLPTVTYTQLVLYKIIFFFISNQNQNHVLKKDLKSKSKSRLPK